VKEGPLQLRRDDPARCYLIPSPFAHCLLAFRRHSLSAEGAGAGRRLRCGVRGRAAPGQAVCAIGLMSQSE
jgi:hypothetical protein